MDREKKQEKRSRFIEVISGRVSNYASLFMVSTLCVSGKLLMESDWAFVVSMLSILVVFLFTIGWIIRMLWNHCEITPSSGRWDSFFSLSSQVLFICMGISMIAHNLLMTEILAYVGMAYLLTEIIYLVFSGTRR